MTTLTLGAKSLKTRITLLTMGVFLVSIRSLTFFVSRMLHDDLEQTLAEQQFATVTLLAEEMNHEVANRLQALESVATQVAPLMAADPGALQRYLAQSLTMQRMFNAGGYVAGLDGTALASIPVETQREGVNYMDRDHVANALKAGQTSVSKPVTGKQLGMPVIGMAAPVRDARGQVIGVVVGVINLAWPNFLNIIIGSSYGRKGGFLVVDMKHRMIVTATNKSRVLEPSPAPGVSPTIDRYLQGYEGSDVLVNPLGVEVLQSNKRVPSAHWYVAVQIPTQEAFAPIHALQQRMAVAAAVLTLLAGLLTWWLLRRQLAPLLATAQVLQKLDPNTLFPMPLTIHREDEVGHLIKGFNALLASLREREAALQESEARYRTLIDWTPDAMYVHRDGKFIYVNPAMVKLFGASCAQDLLGQPIVDRIHPDCLQVVLERIRRSQQENINAELLQEKFVRLDGSVIDVEVANTAVLYDGQSATQVVAHDITERVAAQRLRDEALARLQKIADRVPGMVYQYLLRADGSSCFPFASEGLRQLSRYSPEDVRTDASCAFSDCHPDDMDRLSASILESARSLTPWQQEYRVKFDDGAVRWLFGNALPEQVADGAVLWHGFITDITERKRTEQALQDSLRDKIALLNEVHHRVKNNLQVISSLLRLEAGRSSQSDTRHVLTDMQGRIRAMALLHESLYRAGTFAWVDLATYLTQLASQAFRAQSTGMVRLQLALDSVRVSLDQATPCGLLLNELISNCLKHGFPDGRSGEVRIDLHAVDTVGGQAATSQWCLRVSDTGVGLSADFETRRTQSLGLQLVADLTQQLKGTLQIEPGPGTGAAFAVTFAVAPAVALVS